MKPQELLDKLSPYLPELVPVKKNELMIGNYVSYEHNMGIVTKIDEWIGINLFNGNKGSIPETGLYAIPLTPEILEKFGFEGIKETYKKLNDNLSYIFQMSFTGEGYTPSFANINYSIKYVHQLQNLYFALTNSELIIEL